MIKNKMKRRINGETLKALSLSALFIFFIFFNLNFISSEKFGYNYLEPGENLNTNTYINYTEVNVNNSEYLQGYTPTTLKDWIQGLFDSVYCKLTGCTMTGNIDMGDNSIINVSDIFINDMKGNNGYSSLNDAWNLYTSAGQIQGGEITDNLDQTVTVASGNGTFRIADDDISQIKFMKWDANTSVSIPTDSIRYIGVEYNSGTPRILSKDSNTWNYDTEFPLGSVINLEDNLYPLSLPWQTGDSTTNILEWLESAGPIRDNRVGGLILGYTGTRNPTLTQSNILYIGEEYPITTKDCSGGDSFYAFYRDVGGSYDREGPYTQWNNTYYDDGSGTLQEINNNYYANIWVFIQFGTVDNGQLMLIYPQNEYSNVANAEAEEVPNFPSSWYEHGMLVGRILFKKGVDVPIEVQSSFTTQFTPAQATDHGNLGGLLDDDHTQYLLANGSRKLSGNFNVTGNITFGDTLRSEEGTISLSNLGLVKSAKIDLRQTHSNNSNSGYGFYNTVSVDTTTTPFNEEFTGIFGYPIIIGTNFGDSAKTIGLDFAGAFSFRNNGNKNLSVIGTRITGVQSLLGTIKADDLKVLLLKPISNVFSTGSNVTEITSAYFSDAEIGDIQNFTHMYLEEPTNAENNYGIVLEGTTDILFGGYDGSRVYGLGDDVIINNSNSGATKIFNGTGWGTAEAGTFVEHTYITELSNEEAYKLVKYAEENGGNDGNYSAWGECAYNGTDLSKTEVKNVNREFCKYVAINGYTENELKDLYDGGEITQEGVMENIKEVCSLEEVEETYYPHKKINGINTGCKSVMIQKAYEYSERNIKHYENLTEFDTGIMAENIYTQSKVINLLTNYALKFLNPTLLDSKDTHKNKEVIELPEGNIDVLNVEDRIVDLEGAFSDHMTCMYLHEKYSDYRNCMLDVNPKEKIK